MPLAVRLLRTMVVLCALAAVAGVVWFITNRIGYPFEVNWIEGGVLHHVQRVRAGQPLYVPPTPEFIPFIYPPGYYAAAAGLSALIGDHGFPALRLVSTLSTAVVFAIVGCFAWRETRDRALTIVAIGLLAASHAAGGFWFDVGRVDMLFLALLLSAFYLIRHGSGRSVDLGAGLLLAAAFLTKQSAAVMAAPVVLWLLLVDWRRAAVVILAGGLASIGITVWLDAVHDGWYRFYVFELPSQYRLFPGRLVRFWTTDLLFTVPVAMAFAAAYVLWIARTRERLFLVALATGLVAGAWMSRANDGGNLNVLIPAFLAFGLLMAVAAKHCVAPAGGARCAAAYAAMLVQFAVLAHDPRGQLPAAGSVVAGENLVNTLAAAPGSVWVPYHSYFAIRAGKPGHAHWMAVSDILRYGEPELRGRLEAQLSEAITEQRFSMVVLSSRPFPDFPDISHAYRLEQELFDAADERTLLTQSGAGRRPVAIYVPRQDAGALEQRPEPRER